MNTKRNKLISTIVEIRKAFDEDMASVDGYFHEEIVKSKFWLVLRRSIGRFSGEYFEDYRWHINHIFSECIKSHDETLILLYSQIIARENYLYGLCFLTFVCSAKYSFSESGRGGNVYLTPSIGQMLKAVPKYKKVLDKKKKIFFNYNQRIC